MSDWLRWFYSCRTDRRPVLIWGQSARIIGRLPSMCLHPTPANDN